MIGKSGFFAPVDGHQKMSRAGIVFQVLYPVGGVAGVDKKLAVRLFRPLVVQGSLAQGRGKSVPSGRVVAQQHLMVVVRALQVAVNAVTDEEIFLRIRAAGNLPEGKAVDAAAAVPMGEYAAVHDGLPMEVIHDFLQVDGGHHAVPAGVQVRAGDPVPVKADYVESILYMPAAGTFPDGPADHIVLVFQRAVDAPVLRVKGNAAQMAHQPPDAADQPPLKVRLDQHGGEGKVGKAIAFIQRYALTVTAVKPAGEKGQRMIRHGIRVHEGTSLGKSGKVSR